MGHYRSEVGLDRDEIEKLQRKESDFLREVERRAGEPLARLENFVRMTNCPCSGCEWLGKILGPARRKK